MIKLYTIKLADGTTIENLELNGNNYIANTIIDDSVFVDNLDSVEISDGETTETCTNMRLLSNIARDGRSWIVLGQKSEEQIEKEKLENKLIEMQLLIDTMLGVIE